MQIRGNVQCQRCWWRIVMPAFNQRLSNPKRQETAVILYANIQGRRLSPVSNVILIPHCPSDVTTVSLVEQLQLSRQASETLCHAQFRAKHSLDHSTIPRSSQSRAPNVHLNVPRNFCGSISNPCLGVFLFGPGWEVSVVQLRDVLLQILVVHHPRPIHHSACEAKRGVVDSRCA